LDGSRGIRIAISRRAVFVLLAVFAFLIISAVVSRPAQADLVGPIDLLIGETLESTLTAVEEVVPLEPITEAATEILPPVARETVAQVVQSAPNMVEDVIGVLPPLVGDPVTEIVEEVVAPVARQIDDLAPTPRDPVLIEPVLVEPVPVDSGLVDEVTPGSIVTESPADSTLADHQRQTKEVAVLGAIEQGSPEHAAPSVDDPRFLYGYVPIDEPPSTVPSNATVPASSNLFGVNYGDLSMSPLGFLALLGVLFNFAVVGYLRDRSSSGRSFFPGHSGRPG
jgi:hypothetical protein